MLLEEERIAVSEQKTQAGERARFGEATMSVWKADATSYCDVTGQTGGVFGDNTGMGDDSDSPAFSVLQERSNQDVTDRMFVFLEGATDSVDMTDSLDAILDAMRKGELNATVNKDNKTAIGMFVRASGRLAHTRSRVTDVQGMEAQLHKTAESLVEDALNSVIEIGIHQARRDYLWWLLHDNAASASQLDWFLSTDIPYGEQLVRLDALQGTVELLSAARAIHTPWERLQSLLTGALTFYRDPTQGSHLRPNFVMPLPPFVRSSSTLLSGIVDGPAPASWKLHLQNQAGAARVALLLQHNALDPEAPDELCIPKELLKSAPEHVAAAPSLESGKHHLFTPCEYTASPLDAQYVTYIGRCDKWSWVS